MNKLKKVNLKIFLVLCLSLTIFTLVAATTVSATEPNEDVLEEENDLSVAVIPDEGGYKYQYGGDGGAQEGYTHTHQTNGDSDHNNYNWAWECKN